MIRIVLHRLLPLTPHPRPHIQETRVSSKEIFIHVLQRVAHHSDESLSQRRAVGRVESLLGLQHFDDAVSLDFLHDFAHIVDSIAEQHREKPEEHLLALLQHQLRRRGPAEPDRQPRQGQQNLLANRLRRAPLRLNRLGNAHLRENGQNVDHRGEEGLDGLLRERGHDLHEEFQPVEPRGPGGTEFLEEKEERFGLGGPEHGGEAKQEDGEEEDERGLVGSLLPGVLAQHDGEKPGVRLARRRPRINDLGENGETGKPERRAGARRE